MEGLVLIMSILTCVGGTIGVMASVDSKENVFGFIKNIVIYIFLSIFVFIALFVILLIVVSLWELFFKMLGLK